MRIEMALVTGLALLAARNAAAAGVPTILHISSHLPKAAAASLDGKPAVLAPGEGSTRIAVKAGRHVLKITTSTGATYRATLDLKTAKLMTWRGEGYWCVNLLDRSLEIYSTQDCEEEVTDAG